MSQPLAVAGAAGDQARVSGRFCVFYAGEVRLRFLTADGKLAGAPLRRSASPADAVLPGSMAAGAKIPAGARKAELALFDGAGRLIGELAKAEISTSSPRP